MSNKKNNSEKFVFILLILLLVLNFSNQYFAFHIFENLFAKDSHAVTLTGDPEIDAQILVFSKGIPEIYGEELGVTYEFDLMDQQLMNEMIDKMETYDRGNKTIDVGSLPADIKERYINIGTRISCEFCCSAKSITHKSGDSACGCAHSAAMRGLALYLLTNHPDEYTDDRIFQELARWKALYFPKQMIKKYVTQTETGDYTPDIAALLLNTSVNKNAKGVSIPSPTSIENLPDMAGGC